MVLFTARVSSGLKKSIIISSFAGLMLLLTNSNAAYAVAGINRQINFQGKVVNKTAGTNVANGNYDFTFRLYDAASAGSVLWTENWTAAGGGQLTVTDGIFRVALGSHTTFASANVDFNSDSLYLDITFNGETMGSRIRMTAVPYALNAEKVAGLTVTNNGGNTLNIAANKTFTVNNSITFSGTDSTSFTLPTSGDTLVGLVASQVLTNKTIGNTGLLFENSESISNGTNGTLTFGRNDSGIVTLTAKDDDAVAGLTILPGGAAGLILGGSSMTGLTVTTDSTGDNEVILPDGSIATAEILDASLLPADLDLTTADSAGDEECLTYESSTSDFEWQTCSSAGTNYWQLNAGALSPFSLTADLNLGATATSSAKISLAGSLTRGMAAAIINQTENQDIFTASSSGTTKFTISNLGNVGIRTSPLDNTGLNVQNIGTTFNHLYGVRSNVEVNDGGDYLQDQYGGYFSAGGSGSMDGSYGVYGISTADNFNNDSVGVYGVGGTVGVAGSSGSIGVSGSGGVYGGYFFNDGANGTAVVATQGNGLGLGLSVAGRSEFSAAAHSKALVILNQTGNKDIFTASASGLTKFVISNAGNVGIGDASPDHKLDVEGNMGLSASSYINWGDTDGSGGYGFRDNSGTVEFKNSGGAWIAIPTSAGANYWQLNSGVLTPFSITADTNFGATATASAKISLAGSLTRGKAVAIFNQTENQDILTASASGITKFKLDQSGNVFIGDGSLAAPGFSFLSEAGLGFYRSATNTLSLASNGTQVLSASDVQLSSNVPHQFNAAGDVVVAYDLQFSNQTASYIKSNAGLYIEAGEIFESNSLNLKTYNSGNIIMDTSTTAGVQIGTDEQIGKLQVSGAKTGKALVVLNETGDQDVLTASVSGTTKFRIANNGRIYMDSSYYNATCTALETDTNGQVICGTDAGGGGSSNWQLNSGVLSPFSLTADVNLGATATSSAKVSLAGSLTRGKAAAIINQTEDQDIFAASASGTTKFFVTKEGRTGIGTDTIVGSTERLLQVGSKTNRGNAAVYGDIVSQGVSDITGLTNIKDVYVYDTTSDSDGGRWIDWATTDRLSWYSEALDDSPSDPCNIATDDRCYTTNFPRKAILVVTTDALYIFDAATNDMWMKFTQNAAGYALGIDTNNDPSSVTAANGVVYVGTNGASAGGLYVIDFVNDRMWNYDDTDRSGADVGIASRNSAVTYNSDNNTSLDLGGNTGWKTINDVSVAAVNMSSTAIAATTGPGNGSTFVALATDSGVNLINLSQQKLLQYSRITDDNYESVVVTKNARLYALDSTRDELNMWNNIDSDVTSQLNAAADKAWDETTAPALTRTTPVIATGTPDALEVVERGSLSDSGVTAGASSDLIYVGHSQGLTELHDNATLALGWVKYYDIDLQTALMTGTIRRMHMMDDASGNITNQSNQTDIMTAKGTPGYDATGVRGKAISFNGTDEYLCSDTTGDGTCDNDASDNLGTAAWTISTWFKHSTNITGTDVLFARCYNTTPAAAAGCVAASMVASGQMTVNVDFDATFTIGVTGTTVFHTSTQTYNDNQWHHLIVTRAATTGNINTMIDGKPIGQTAGLNTTLDASQILGIGTDCSVGAACGTGGNFWEGSIDDFMLSTGTNNNLSTTVMRRLYNDARPLVGKRVVTVVNATTFSTTTIGDSGEAWIPNEFAGMIVTLTGNTGAGQTRRITGNTATTLTVSPAFSTTPDATTDFEIDPEALYGASNVVTSVGITAESPIGEARQMCVGTNDGSDGGGVTCYNHQAGPNIIADLFHGDSVQTDDSGVEWTGANYDDIRSIDVSGRAIVIGSEAHFYTETSDVRLGQGLDYLANQMFNVKSEILNDGIGTVGSLGVEVGFTGGADIAEYFESDGVMQPGQIVSIHKTITSGVQLADKEYQKDIIGVVATRPGLTLGGQKETSYPVALTGRVPVIIAAESGSVLRGDAITSSNVPGVGKRAIQRGTIVGIALEGNADWDEVNCPVVTSVDEITWPEDDTGSNGARPCFKVITEEKKEMYIGKLMVFMNPGYYQGDEIVTADAVNKSASISVIGAFNAANDDQAVTINTAGEFIIKNSEGETVATVDKYGNMHIADVIHPQKVDMNTIEGMDDYMKRVNILEANVASLSAALEIVSSSSAMFSWDPLWLDIAPRREVSMSATESGLLAIDLSTGSDATVSGKLRVQGSSLFEEMVTMVGDVMMNNILVNGIADFFGKTIFHEDVEIRGKLMVGSDTSGIAIIRKHTDVVDVVFAGVYEEIPLVTTSISLDSIVNEEASKEVQKQQEEAQTKLEQAILNGDIQYVITRKTKRGFVIKLNKRAPEDIQFTWTALASSKLGVSNDSTVLSDKTPVDDSFERESVEPLQTPSPTTHELNEQPERTVTILPSELGYLRVRSGPRSSFDEVGQVRPDASFTVIESQNGWFMIEYDDAKTGWVSSLYVAVKQ